MTEGVEDGRGSLVHAATLRFPSPLIGRVEDWRAGVGRSLCSLLSRPFVCECHTISTMPRFQPPPRRTQRADFLALRSPVCFCASTGGKQKLGPISKQGDRYLRRILVVGAHSVLRRAKQNPEKYPWLTQLLARRPFKVVAIALANKTARTAWALLAKGGTYRAAAPAAA
jgi:hypothetical protein